MFNILLILGNKITLFFNSLKFYQIFFGKNNAVVAKKLE